VPAPFEPQAIPRAAARPDPPELADELASLLHDEADLRGVER
jgi:hypothetical protein